MKLDELLDIGIRRLKEYNIDEPNLKAKVLLSYLLDIQVSSIMIHFNNEIEKSIEEEFFRDIIKICKHVPIQYITNSVEFMKLKFYVDENVLIPQPDTEILVEEVLKLVKEDMKILDLCTGSGVIAVSIAKYANKVNVFATDISKLALKIAEKNAIDNVTPNSIVFVQADMFEGSGDDDIFDIIVSNPPYIETGTIKLLDKEVQNEPTLALDGGIDGLDFYREISNKAKSHLAPNGYLCLEIGYNQRERVIEILEKYGYVNIRTIKDLSGNDRVIICEVS